MAAPQYKLNENGETWEKNGSTATEQEQARSRDQARGEPEPEREKVEHDAPGRHNVKDYSKMYQKKGEQAREKKNAADKEREREKERAHEIELAKAGRAQNRTVVQNRVGGRQGGSFLQPMDFSGMLLNGGNVAGNTYADPFGGMSMPRLEVGSLQMGRGTSLFQGQGSGMRSAYADPFRSQGGMFNLKGGIFDRSSARTSLTGGIFSRSQSPGRMQSLSMSTSLFGASASKSGNMFDALSILSPPKPRPTRKKAKPAAKKGRGQPAVYGNAAAAKRGAVVVQHNGKTRKVPVKKLPSKRQRK